MAIRPGRRTRAHLVEGRLHAPQAPRAAGHQAQHPGRAPATRPPPQPVSQRRPLVGKAPPCSTQAQSSHPPTAPRPTPPLPSSASNSSTPWRRCWRRSRPCASRCRPRSSALRLWRTCCASWWTARTSASRRGSSKPGGQSGAERKHSRAAPALGPLDPASLGLGRD